MYLSSSICFHCAQGNPEGDIFATLAPVIDELRDAVQAAGVNIDIATLQSLSLSAISPAPSSLRSSSQPVVQHAAASMPAAAEAGDVENQDVDANRRHLQLELNGGKAFLSHLDSTFEDEEEVDEHGGQSASSGARGADGVRRFYVLHMLCCGQRFRTALVPVAVEPGFAGQYTMDVQPEGYDALAPLSALLQQPSTSCGIHFVLTLVTQRTRPLLPSVAAAATAATDPAAASAASASAAASADVTCAIVGTALLDWRSVLGEPEGCMDTLLQLAPAGPGPHAVGVSGSPVPVGLLSLSLRLLPACTGVPMLPRPDVSFALSHEASKQQEQQRSFVAYAKAWWNDYKALNPAFKHRLVKIFAQSDNGDHQPVISFLCPLTADRVVESPSDAARFVSLLPFRRPEQLGGLPARRDTWHSLHATIASRGGDVEDHCTLLASLLLGFHLDAFVAIGVRTTPSHTEEEYAWVVTRYASPAGIKVVFWDSLTGQRCAPAETLQSGHKFSRVACLFSADRFYACASADDNVDTVSWDLDNEAHWKPVSVSWIFSVLCALLTCYRTHPVLQMEAIILQKVPHTLPVPLAPCSLDTRTLALALETTLRAAVEAYRATPTARARLAHARGGAAADAHSVTWDNRLSFLLQTALSSYETERLHGIPVGAEEFASVVKRTVPRGHVFRAFPILFNHLSPTRMMDALIAAPAAKAVLETPSDASTRFGLRVFVCGYAEDCSAVWAMIAAVSAT